MTNPATVNILLVEDALTMRKIEIQTLKALGYTSIVEAVDGKEAIAILEGGRQIDFVISDWNMPNLGGYELLTWIRGQEKYKSLPFLMATAQADRAQAEKALAGGANGIIAKPFSEGELQAKIEQSLGLRDEVEPSEEERGPQRGASGKIKLRVAHIQITDHLVLGVLKHWIERGEVVPNYFELETQCMPGWNPVEQAIDKGTVDAAFVLAPIAMDLFRFGVPIKLVMFAHRSGSIFVRSRKGNFEEPYQDFFRGRSVLIPHKMSVHHMLTHMFFKGIGLHADLEKGADVDVNLEVVAPINMPTFLRDNADASGFMVAEPIGTKSIATGIAELQFLSNELWKYHPCCVVTVRDDFAGEHRDAVFEFTKLMVKAGQFIEQRPDTAAEIAVHFLDPHGKIGLKVPVLRNVLKEPEGIKTGDLYPSKDDLDKMQQYMVQNMGVGGLVDLDQFVDTRYADLACQGLPRKASSFLHTDAVVSKILKPRHIIEEGPSKSMLNKEGRYLTFVLAEQEFGVNILKVKEIIKMMDFVKVHQVPSYAKGVINLRGQVIPIIDLRSKLGMEEIAYSDRSCIVIIDAEQRGVAKSMGIVVDTVSEVLAIKSSDIDDPPSFGAAIDVNYILGMAKTDTGVKVLLDIDSALH